MKKSFDINVTSYDAKTVITIIKPDEIISFTGELIRSIKWKTDQDKIYVYFNQSRDAALICHNAWEWNKAKELILTVMPDQKGLTWHKKKFKGHPCYQDYSKP